MAEPKKRTNRSRTNSRRLKIRAKTPDLIYCQNCHSPVIQHHVCKICGYYRGKKAFNIDDKIKIDSGSEDNQK